MINKQDGIVLIDKLAGVLSTTSGQIVSEYSVWFIADSIAWILAAILCIPASFRLVKLVGDQVESDTKVLISSVLGVVCLMFILAGLHSVSDLIAPEAAAIHQLIIDIKS